MDQEKVLSDINRVVKSKKYVNFTNTQVLGKFVKNLRHGIKIVRNINIQQKGVPEPKIKVERVRVVTKKSIRPGKILIFNYVDEQGQASIRKILTVNCARTGNGTWFLSTQNNDLLTGYDLNNITVELLIEVLNNLVDNSTACTYQSTPTELMSIVPDLKPNEFRTYNINNMTNVNVMSITGMK